MATTLTLAPAVVNLVGVRAGDRNQFTLSLVEGGNPVNLTGLTVSAQARKSATDVDPPALSAVVDITDAPGGRISVRWPGDEVRAVLAGGVSWLGVWDLQLDDGVGDPWTIVAGTFAAETDVTRP